MHFLLILCIWLLACDCTHSQAAIQTAAAEASRTQAALDRRQSRRLHFTLRRALEKLGAQVHPAASPDADHELVHTDRGQGHQEQQEESVTNQLEAETHIDSVQKATTAAGSTDIWLFNEQLGPYNVSFYCPAKKVSKAANPLLPINLGLRIGCRICTSWTRVAHSPPKDQTLVSNASFGLYLYVCAARSRDRRPVPWP